MRNFTPGTSVHPANSQNTILYDGRASWMRKPSPRTEQQKAGIRKVAAARRRAGKK